MIQGLYTFFVDRIQDLFQTFSRPLFFIFQTEGNSEILHGLRRNNCLNYENKFKKFSFSCLIVNLQWQNQNTAVY